MNNQNQIRKEHELVRNSVGFYDFTLETLEVTGKDAREFLDYVFVNNVAKMKENEALYTSMLDKDGNVLDDLILFCREPDKFWVTTGYIDQLKKWFNDNLENKEVDFKDITDEKAIYAIQGPKSRDVLNALVKDNIDDLKSFKFKDTTVEGMDVMASRTGFTGELGYELHFDPKDTDKLKEAILEKGKPYGIEELVTDVTLGSLPGEKGFITIEDFEGANPIELGLGWTVHCDKDFIGKEKTCALKDQGAKRNLLGFTVEDNDAKIEKDDKVKLNGKEVGKVTTATYGFTVEKNIGYALVDSEAKKDDKVTIVTADGDVEATLQERMFYDPKGEKVNS